MADDSIVLQRNLLIPLEDIVPALTQCRRASGRSQDAVGHRAGRHRKWVSEFERQIFAPTLTRLLAHAEALGLEIRIVLCKKDSDGRSDQP